MGHTTMDEGFLDHPNDTSVKMHPQSLIMEFRWVAEWFKRVITEAPRDAVCFIDRSPYSACFYAKNKSGRVMKIVIDDMIKELETETGIMIRTVHLKVNTKVLWPRIAKRLKDDPSRLMYNEDSRDWMDEVVRFYDDNKWTHVIQNDKDIDKTCQKILSTFKLK